MELAPNTRNVYMTRVRKLVKVYPYVEDVKQKELCWREIVKLCDKLGIEPDSPLLLRGPGRPRVEAFDLKEATVKKEVRSVEKSEAELHEMEKLAREKKERLAAMVKESTERVEREKKERAEEEERRKGQVGEGTQAG